MKTCAKCKLDKDESAFPKRGYSCKSCHNAYCRAKIMNGHRCKSKTHGTKEHFVTSHWQSIRERTVNSGSTFRGNEAYRRKAISLEMSRVEFELWVSENWGEILRLSASGERPTIDRMDAAKGYAISNIQILSYSKNSSKDKWLSVFSINPVTGEKTIYPTTEKAVDAGFNRACIQGAICRGSKHRGLFWGRPETEKAIMDFQAAP